MYNASVRNGYKDGKMEKVKSFQVKEVCKICNVTRKALLIYEGKGLLTPYYINKDTGYRYYNAENISKIMHIRKFQSFGFSLDEIYDYLNDTKKISEVCNRLNKIKTDLESVIDQLQIRMMTKEYDKQQIIRTNLPTRTYYVKRAITQGFMDALNFLRDTHLEAIKTGFADTPVRMHTSIFSYEGDAPDIYGTCDIAFCILMNEGYEGKNAVKKEATPALSILHRGSYKTLKESAKILLDYCKDNAIRPAGPISSIWLEGPPVHGSAEEKYLTQISIPVEE